MTGGRQFYVKLEDVDPHVKPGWKLIEKDDNRILYVPRNSVVYFTWGGFQSSTLYTNYPDSFSSEFNKLES
jgi:hypothetical protein